MNRSLLIQGLRSTAVGIVANLFLALIKGVAGIAGHSQALVADAVESLTDVVSSFIVFAGLAVAGKPPDENHPYGHGKAEPLATLAVSVALLAAATGLVVQSVRQILTPHSVPETYTLLVLCLVVVTKELLYRFVVKVGDAIGSGAVAGDAWHHRSDAITSFAAAVGIIVALAGGPGWESADDWAALLACGVIFYNASRIGLPALHELMDVAPPPAMEEAVRSTAAGVDGVRGLHRCFVRKMGFDYFVDLDVQVEGHLTVHQGHDIAHRVQDAVREADPRVKKVLVHVEPYYERGGPSASG